MAVQFSTDEADSKQNNSRTIISRVNLSRQSLGISSNEYSMESIMLCFAKRELFDLNFRDQNRQGCLAKVRN
ncbi:hypothetical protein LBMAG32_09870 [Nitrosomonadaceae bacterium]|nr:hypothetical protein LBMAG32_09870 [Nitrosomonadaceae bacterium]